MALLHSNSDSETVHRLIVTDRGMVQGVPAQGVVDTGAEITNMEGELFQKVTSANWLKKSEFKHRYNTENRIGNSRPSHQLAWALRVAECALIRT